jgi:hypothetical protein
VSLGIQSSVQIASHLFTIETETRDGAEHHLLDTTVYVQGRVLYRRVKSYQDLLEEEQPPDANALRERIEAQHRGVVDDLRSGALKFELQMGQAPAPMPASRGTIEFPAGIEVRLMNPSAWLRDGAASLDIEVRARATLLPASGMTVEVTLEGVEPATRMQAGTDPRGRVSLTFPMPKIGPEGGQLVIRASGAVGQDELRYRLKPRARESGLPVAQVK